MCKDEYELTAGTSLFSAWVLAASVVTFLLTMGLKAALIGALRRMGAAQARGAKRDSMSAALWGDKEGLCRGGCQRKELDEARSDDACVGSFQEVVS